MIKNSILNVYDRMDKKTLKIMALSFEGDFPVAKDEGRGDFIMARLAIIYALLKYKFK